MRPAPRESSKLRGVVNTLDALDGMDVVKALSRAVGCVLITGVWAPGVGRTQCLPRVQGALAAGGRRSAAGEKSLSPATSRAGV
jgi:hypothetical protein